MSAERIDGESVAAEIRADIAATVNRLREADVTPTLATVLMADDPSSETYVSMKERDCAEVGIETRHVDIPADAPQAELLDTVAALNDDPAVHGILVQLPLPDGVDDDRVVRAIDPPKDVDGFHPRNVGRLVRGDPRHVPCTPLGVCRLLSAASVPLAGSDVTIVGRSNIVGKPLATLLLAADATVTLCHSQTEDLGAKTRAADVVVVAAGVPELVDGSMISPGATVVDVGINRVERDGTERLVGDVDAASVREVADALTPVPGGVGPMTRAMLLRNTVRAAVLATERDLPVEANLGAPQA